MKPEQRKIVEAIIDQGGGSDFGVFIEKEEAALKALLAENESQKDTIRVYGIEYPKRKSEIAILKSKIDKRWVEVYYLRSYIDFLTKGTPCPEPPKKEEIET